MYLRYKFVGNAGVIYSSLPPNTDGHNAAIDLRATRTTDVVSGEVSIIRTGLMIELPRNWCGLVIPRSGLARDQGLTIVNSPGLIDPGYRGEIMVLATTLLRDWDFRINRGDRIAQLLLTTYEAVMPMLVEDLSQTSRGEAGFGSSGVA